MLHDVEKICELQHKLDEYERFHGELFLMIYEGDTDRNFVRFDEQVVPFAEDLIKQIKKLIAKC